MRPDDDAVAEGLSSVANWERAGFGDNGVDRERSVKGAVGAGVVSKVPDAKAAALDPGASTPEPVKGLTGFVMMMASWA